MIDNAHSETDKKLEKMETYLTDLYRKSAKGITKKWYEYMENASKKIETLQQDYDHAKSLGDKTLMKRAGIKLAKAKKDITIHNEYYKAMLDEVTFQLSHVNETATAYINNQLPEIYTINYNAVAPEALSVGIRFDIRDAHTIKRLILDGEIELPKTKIDIPKDMQWNKKQINSSVLQGILQGESIDKIAGRIYDVVGKNKQSAIRNARTMITSAENHGRIDSYQDLAEKGVIEKKVWMSTPDDRTRPSHIDMDGEEQDINAIFSNGCMFPGDGKGPPEEVWMCFPAETSIATDCDIISSYKRWYDGDLIKIKTAGGVEFSCTPNHPILSEFGWVSAASLNNGDNLLVTFVGDDSAFVSGGNPNIKHIFPRMDTLHQFLYEVFGKRICNLSVNFHGDITTPDVEVVTQKRFLRVDRDSGISKRFNKFLFKLSHSFLSCKSYFMQRFFGHDTIASGSISSRNKFFTFFGRSMCHSVKHGFGTVTRANAILKQTVSDNISADSEFFCKSLDGLSGMVFLDKIVDINIYSFHGFVYNLHTENNFYLVKSLPQSQRKVNGIFAIAHNCRCTLHTHIIGIRGASGRIDYLKRVETGQTMHEKQMQEEKQRRKDNEDG